MIRSFYFYFFIVTASLGCTSPEKLPTPGYPTLIDLSNPFETDSLISPRKLFSDVEYIKLGSSDEFLLTDVKKILELDKKIFVHDWNKKVLVAYDLKGNFLGQIGTKGVGPKEYQGVYDFNVNPKTNTILIYSARDQAILEFGRDLKFKKRQRFDIFSSQFSLLESGNVALYGYFTNESGNIPIFSEKGKLLDMRMPILKDGHYLPMDYSGFIMDGYYTYPLATSIYKIEEEKSNDLELFRISFPGKISEDLVHNHDEFKQHFGEPNYNILCRFSIGGNSDELLFLYTYDVGVRIWFSLGVKLKSNQTFGHLNLKHGAKTDDPFVRFFVTGPYNLPIYSEASGRYYVASNNEFVNHYYDGDKDAALKRIKRVDIELYKVLKEMDEDDNPILMRFKLKEGL